MVTDKLILFDIDDTLVRRSGNHEVGWDRWASAIRQVFGKDIGGRNTQSYDGWVDRQIGWDLVKTFNVSRAEYERLFPEIADALYLSAVSQSLNGVKCYDPINESVSLVNKIREVPGIHLGLLTGNLEKVGWWKLGQAGIEGLFKFGLFSDQAQSRMEIAKNAITLANIYFKTDFQPENTYVLGDTVYDIRCGKSISAKTIGIENPRLHNFQALSDEKADIVVRSLDEDKVYNYITS